jgi:hypothetical protein
LLHFLEAWIGEREGPFGSSNAVQPPSDGGVVDGAEGADWALLKVRIGGAQRRPARFARRFSGALSSKWSESSSEDVKPSRTRNGAAPSDEERLQKVIEP